MNIIAIDPGKHGCGLAVFENTVLVRAEYVPEVATANHALLGAADAVIQIVRDLQYGKDGLLIVDETIIERPQVYQSRHQKGSQEDITELSIIVGALLYGLGVVDDLEPVSLVYPREWKGQATKEVTTARAEKALSVRERSCIMLPKQKVLKHNVWDAISIGMWKLGR